MIRLPAEFRLSIAILYLCLAFTAAAAEPCAGCFQFDRRSTIGAFVDMSGQLSADGRKMTFVVANATGGTSPMEFTKQ